MNISTEELMKALQIANQVELGKKYDQYEAENGKRLGYVPDYSYAANGLAGNINTATVNTPGMYPHFSDAGKLPNHATFSDESIFSSQQHPGGHWVGKDDSTTHQDIFYPSTQQLRGLGYLDKLQNYYDQNKGNGIDKVIVPPPYKNIKQ